MSGLKNLLDRVAEIEARREAREAPQRFLVKFGSCPADLVGLRVIDPEASFDVGLAPYVPGRPRRVTAIRLPPFADEATSEAALRIALEVAAKEGFNAEGVMVLPHAATTEEWEHVAAATPEPPTGPKHPAQAGDAPPNPATPTKEH